MYFPFLVLTSHRAFYESHISIISRRTFTFPIVHSCFFCLGGLVVSLTQVNLTSVDFPPDDLCDVNTENERSKSIGGIHVTSSFTQRPAHQVKTRLNLIFQNNQFK